MRAHGGGGPAVVVLHGGPGAPGSAAGLARALAPRFRVLEPLQRRAAPGAALDVALHVADLHEVLEALCRGERPALVGHSWGAMLALAYAAAHPGRAAALALVGCGTFDPEARARLRAELEARTGEELRRRWQDLPEEIADADERLGILGRLTLPLYTFRAAPAGDSAADLPAAVAGEEAFDALGHEQSWSDMLRLQEEGVYPGAFAAVSEPVLMLHGAYDPHPGRLIRAGLEAFLPQIEYREWERCGHYPWLEADVRQEFVACLSDWLSRRLASQPR